MRVDGLSDSALFSSFKLSVSSVDSGTDRQDRADSYSSQKISLNRNYNIFGRIEENIFERFRDKSLLTGNISEASKALSGDSSEGGAEDKRLSEELKEEVLIVNHQNESSVFIRNADDLLYKGGADSMEISGSERVSVELKGDDKDVFISDSADIHVKTDAGDDQFYINDSKKVAVYSDEGDDSVSLFSSSDAVINSGSGADRVDIYNSDNVAVNGGIGDDNVNVLNSHNLYLNGGGGDDKLTAHGLSNSEIYGGDGNDKIDINFVENTRIQCGSGDDEIKLDFVRNVLITGGSGDDSITTGLSENVSVIGGRGDDTIYGFGIIDGGRGDDNISASGLIRGGTGDDYISLREPMTIEMAGSRSFENTVYYSYGDGYDIVNSKGVDSRLDMSGISSEDVIIKEYFNEDTGYNEMSVQMKDGSGSISFVSEKDPEMASLYENAAKIKEQMNSWLGVDEEVKVKEVRFTPEQIRFSDKIVQF